MFAQIYTALVNWREEEESIICYFNGRLKDIQLSKSPKDRYIAIWGLRDIISEKCDLKLFECSYMSDTKRISYSPKRYAGKGRTGFPLIKSLK